TMERETFEVEAGFRICDVDRQPGSESYNQCINLRGIGTDYESARNLLDGNLINAESKNVIILDRNNHLEFGIGFSNQQFDDKLHEYSFIDSADYVNITEMIKADNHTNGNQYTGYLQHYSVIRSQHAITYGIRLNYFDLNEQLLVSPRLQYAYMPDWDRDIVFRSAVGLYQQPPLYREFRNFEGKVDKTVKAQSSIHFIAGLDYNLSFGGRPFKFMAEAYYKFMYDVNPYDIDNVRIRYYATNDARAHAAGLDFRISGEFIPGDESWFSLGLMRSREDLYFDDRGWIPRPTDQLVNFNIFFQDHIPNAPTYRVYLNFNFASGLPFGPPGNPDNRNLFRGDSYQRVDIGFSKIFYLKKKFPESIWLGLEILNLTGRANNISYYWVRDYNHTFYGVPNSLTTRFFNIKLIIKI
ncbi:MAG: TonB-dependent receptor, partial [Cyclobacteriaceae bacterium]|nr:TonB-dependent receptor [Cyclobacteriaceae bacterium]